jgi:hypothetical protein
MNTLKGGHMPTRVLIDNFVGDPEAFYALVIEEVNQRSLPEVQFRWVEEAESNKRFFNNGEKLRALNVTFHLEWIVVFAYQLGNCFFVSTRLTNEPNTKLTTYLQDVRLHIFDTVVERSVKRALARHMEERGSALPGFLATNDNSVAAGQSAS